MATFSQSILGMFQNPGSELARRFRAKYPDQWNQLASQYTGMMEQQQQAQQQQQFLGSRQRPSAHQTQERGESLRRPREPTHYRYGKPAYGRVPSRGRGPMHSPGFQHFSNPEKGFIPDAGKQIDRGAYLDNLHKMRRSNLYNPLGRSVSGQSSLRPAPMRRMINSQAGHKAQLDYLAELRTQQDLVKKLQEDQMESYLSKFGSTSF